VLERLKSKKIVADRYGRNGAARCSAHEQLVGVAPGRRRARVLLALPAQGEGHALEEITTAFSSAQPRCMHPHQGRRGREPWARRCRRRCGTSCRSPICATASACRRTCTSPSSRRVWLVRAAHKLKRAGTTAARRGYLARHSAEGQPMRDNSQVAARKIEELQPFECDAAGQGHRGHRRQGRRRQDHGLDQSGGVDRGAGPRRDAGRRRPWHGERRRLAGLHTRFHLGHVINGDCALEDAIVTGPHGLQIVPAASGIKRMANLSAAEHAGIIRAFSDLYHRVDVLVIDTAAGLHDSVVTFTRRPITCWSWFATSRPRSPTPMP
jgi:hypothetical protein